MLNVPVLLDLFAKKFYENKIERGEILHDSVLSTQIINGVFG